MALTKITKTANVAMKGNVTVKHKKTGAIVKEEVSELVTVPKPYANVGVTAGRTIPLEEFGNVKIAVSLYRPCADNEQAIEETYDFCIGWVDEKMKLLISDHTPAQSED